MKDQIEATSVFDAEPHNIELEQQLLGAVLSDNERMHKIAGLLKPEHFFDPVHERIFKAIQLRLKNEHIASPVTLKTDLENDEGLKELGGAKYLARLVGASISGFAVRDYAEQIVYLANKREVMAVLKGAAEKIADGQDVGAVKSGVEVSLAEVEDTGKESTLSIAKAFTEAIRHMNDAYQEGMPVGIQTGLTDLDRRIGGLFAPDLMILAGRPSMGKTALATSLALRTARQRKAVAIVSLEMDGEGLAHRILSELSGVQYNSYRKAHDMTEADFRKTVDAANENAFLPIEIVPPHVRDPGAIISALRKVDQKHKNIGGLGLVVVDYLQLVSERGQNKTEQIGNVSNALKKIAQMLHVPVLALSQLSRGVEARDNKRPMLSDLRDSGQIEQDADVVMFCYRESYYLEREKAPEKPEEQADFEAAKAACKNVMEVITAKQRFGSIGTDRIGCAIATNRFWDLGASADEQEEIAF